MLDYVIEHEEDEFGRMDVFLSRTFKRCHLSLSLLPTALTESNVIA